MMTMCTTTYEDALSWSSDRLSREITELCRYMNDHWALMIESNKQDLLREYRALRAAVRTCRLRAAEEAI
jgi:hypothetical protein